MTQIKRNLIRKGVIGELKAKTICLEKGYNIYESICDDVGVDFIIEKDNNFKKIQVKTATKITKKHNRLCFRLGNTNNEPDFFLCMFEQDYWCIPNKKISSQAFNIYPKGKSRLNKFKNVVF